jgi:hypothetical protein
MAYATTTLIRQHLPERWRDDADLRARCDDVQAAAEDDIEQALSVRYTVPVTVATSPDAYAVVQRLCARLTVARAMLMHRALDEEEAGSWYPRDLERQVMAQLNAYREGSAQLPDDAVLNPDPPGLTVADGYDGLTATQQGYWEPFFSRGKVW